MIMNERLDQIYEIIKEKTMISYKELAKLLYTSESTVRRDTRKLHRQGFIKLVYGGVSIAESSTEESAIMIREQTKTKEKKIIAQNALAFFQNGMSCFFDSSTTVGQLVYFLKDFKDLKIITDGIDNALLLTHYTNAKTYLSGGEVQKRVHSTQGTSSYHFIKNFNCDCFFFSCRGLSPEGDVTEASIETQQNKQAMFAQSKYKILLIDNSKINMTHLVTTANIKDINALITDKKPPENIIALCEKYNVKLIY